LVVNAVIGACDHALESLALTFETGEIAHLHDHEADDIHPDGSVGQPAQALQRSDHSQSHADSHENNHTGNEADAFVGQLSDGLTTCENQHGHGHEYSPQDPTGEGSSDTEDEVESDTRTVANTSKNESVFQRVSNLAHTRSKANTYGVVDQPRMSVVIR
jgi:hypothetical protein